jgi:putative flippase GtrA
MSEIASNVSAVRWFKNPLNPPIAFIAKRYGGKKWRELERFLRFAVVGISGAIIDLGTLTILQATALPPARSLLSPLMAISGYDPGVSLAYDQDEYVALATTIAFVLAVISNFVWTSLWVYPDSRARTMRRQISLFILISVAGWIGRTLWVTFTYRLVGRLSTPLLIPFIHMMNSTYEASLVAQNKIGTLITQMIAMWFVMIWNFLANRYWTFNDVD